MLRHRDFRNLFLGQSLSTIGDRIVFVAGAVEVWQIVAIEALYGTAEAFSEPAHTGLLPQAVPEDEIQQANGNSSSSSQRS